MLAKESAVGRHLRAVAPRVFTHDDDRPALRIRAGKISQRQGIGSDMHANAFERGDRAAGAIWLPLTAATPSASLFAWNARMPLDLSRSADVAQNVEEPRNRGPGISGEQVNTPLVSRAPLTSSSLPVKTSWPDSARKRGSVAILSVCLPRVLRQAQDRRGLPRKMLGAGDAV